MACITTPTPPPHFSPGDGRLDVITASEGDNTVGDCASVVPGVACPMAAWGLLRRSSSTAFPFLPLPCKRQLAWFRSNGGAPLTFTQRTLTSTGQGARWVHTADINGE
jgi:hypothetical protein